MADGGTGEKTEEPTPERLRKLRKEGNVSKSQDITMAASFLATFITLALSFSLMGDEMFNLFHAMMLAVSLDQEAPGSIGQRVLMQALWTFTKVVAPVCVAAVVVGIAGNVAQVGFMFTLKPITPDIKKINPVTGFKNLFNMKKVVETIKTVIKFTLIAYLSYAALKDALREIVLIIRVGV